MSGVRDWHKAWSALPERDRMRWLIIGTATLIGLYGLLVFPGTNKALTRSEALLARRIDRIEKRAQVPDVDAAAAGTLQARLARLTVEREALEARHDALAGRFAPAEDDEAHQSLLLELNTLAQANGIRLLKQGAESDKDGQAQVLKDSESGRSYMRVRGEGDYWGLLGFLKGLKELSYASAPLGMTLTLKDDATLDMRVDVTL